jgi:TonB-linked SusC/RagA family outer membrane protein
MKKNSIAGREPLRYSPWLKRLLIMKMIAILLLVVGLTSSYAESDAQTAKLNLKFKSGTVKDVIEEIERQTDLSFMYDNNVFRVDRPITIDAENETVKSVIEKLISGENLKYEMVNRYIVITSDNNSTNVQQQKSVSGKVTDSSGNVLPGVSVVVKGTTTGTITDANGNYRLNNIPENATLQFSFIGMKANEAVVGNKTVVNTVMAEETFGIDEVVAVGYGTMKKGDVTGALSVVTSKEFESRPTTQLGDALEGKIAGVQISKPSGQPQAGYNIRIRGISTITAGSEPLYIVDGVPTTSINEIDPTDIESISILKDASSAAIYGASGSNGVVLITTKRGSNQETKVNFNAYYGVANVWKKQDVLDASQYKELMTEMGKTTDWSLYKYNNNWQDRVFRSAQTKNSQISVSGGNEKTSFYLSGSYLNQEGVVITNSLEKYNFRVNLDHKISNAVKIGTSISYSKWNDVSVSEGGKWSTANAILTGSPVTDVYDADGTFSINPFISDLENPVALLLQDEHGYKNHRFNGNMYAEISILKELKFKSMFGIEEQNGTYNSWIDPIRSRWGRTNQGLASYSNSQNLYWISENTLSFNKVVGDHNIGAMAGFITSERNSEGSSIDAKGFGSPAVHTVNAGATRNAGYWESAKSNAAFLGRINYGYADKYLLTANFRADASSVFGANSKWGYFPSFSAGWRISKEGFFGENNTLNDLKIRAGWGIVGNDQVGDYSSFGLVSPGSFYVIGGQKVPGTAISSMENADLKWEQTAQTNIGVDASLLNSRINISADYYIKNTTDMLLKSPIPGSVGMGYDGSFATKNIGSMTNKGLEFQVNSKNLVGELKWTTDFNISFNKSEITKLDKGVPIKTGYISFRGNVAIAQEGEPLGTFFGYVADGVDPQTGMMKYKDLDNSGDLNDGDQTLIGNANPDFTYGLTNNFSYKRITFSFFFQGVQGNDIFNASRIETEGMYLAINQLATVADRWKKPGDITDIPKSSGDGDDHNSLLSSRYVEDGSYLRLKSATLGYDLPKSICNKLKAQKLYVYVTGENLLTFTKYSGFDPEVSIYGRGSDNALKNIAPGVDYGVYPQSRTFLFGINLTF